MRAVVQNLHGGPVAFGKRGELLLDAVFQDPEIGRLQPVDVFALVVGHREAEDHQIDLGFENRRARLLRKQPDPAASSRQTASQHCERAPIA